jgi:YidC/Oxa1 family membrane protein insertase
MDRNQIIGILLIAAILIVTSIITSPSKEEIEKARREKVKQDSIAQAEREKDIVKNQQLADQEGKAINKTQIVAADSLESDTATSHKIKASLGAFGESGVGTNKFITLENDLIKLTLSTKGGRPYAVEMKNYTRYDSLPVVLFNGDENNFGLTFFADNRKISTNDLFFTLTGKDSVVIAERDRKSVSLRLYAGDKRYIEYIYSLEPEKFLVNFEMNFVGLDQLVSKTMGTIDLNWYMKALSIEKGKDWEDQSSGVYFKHHLDEVDWLSETSSKDQKSIPTKIKWIAFKQQFFASIFIANDAFLNGKIEHKKIENDPNFLKEFNAFISLPYKGESRETYSFTFFYGPTQYKILNKVMLAEDEDLNLTRLIPLGWGIFGWINKYAIIPLFNWLGGFISNYGLLILIMTIIIKLVLFPLTYKSYVSSAKMRVLKPQIDELNAKIPKEKAMERQQAAMALYKKAGVNPMGGCLPMLLQFPILIAMFRFFPASIELRQKPFLWTDDLSSYDSILDLPFTIPFYGDHVSLFTLLMAVSMILSTKISSYQMQGTTQMPGMQLMIWMMPVMMLFWFNSYSSGLSYYYFLTNIITVGQTLIIRRFVDDEEVLRKLNENKKKPVTKSKFQQRLEDMAKQRELQQKKSKGKK